MIYAGLMDPAVPPAATIDYYDRLVAASGGPEPAATFARLFLLPGMGHCLGGPGATDIGQPFASDVPADRAGDALMTLVAWTEGGPAPAALLARKPAGTGTPAQERPVCAYPALPAYRGGDTARRTSFACTERPRGTDQAPATRYLN